VKRKHDRDRDLLEIRPLSARVAERIGIAGSLFLRWALILVTVLWSIYGVVLRFSHPSWTETQLFLALIGCYP